jgi:hypothetical protein
MMLMIVAFWRRRQRARATLARWAAEEVAVAAETAARARPSNDVMIPPARNTVVTPGLFGARSDDSSSDEDSNDPRRLN